MKIIRYIALAIFTLYSQEVMAMAALRAKQGYVADQSIARARGGGSGAATIPSLADLKKLSSLTEENRRYKIDKQNRSMEAVAEEKVALYFNIFDPSIDLNQAKKMADNTSSALGNPNQNPWAESIHITALLSAYETKVINNIVTPKVFQDAQSAINIDQKWDIAYDAAITFFYNVHTKISYIGGNCMNNLLLIPYAPNQDSYVSRLCNAVKTKALSFNMKGEGERYTLLKKLNPMNWNEVETISGDPLKRQKIRQEMKEKKRKEEEEKKEKIEKEMAELEAKMKDKRDKEIRALEEKIAAREKAKKEKQKKELREEIESEEEKLKKTLTKDAAQAKFKVCKIAYTLGTVDSTMPGILKETFTNEEKYKDVYKKLTAIEKKSADTLITNKLNEMYDTELLELIPNYKKLITLQLNPDAETIDAESANISFNNFKNLIEKLDNRLHNYAKYIATKESKESKLELKTKKILYKDAIEYVNGILSAINRAVNIIHPKVRKKAEEQSKEALNIYIPLFEDIKKKYQEREYNEKAFVKSVTEAEEEEEEEDDDDDND